MRPGQLTGKSLFSRLGAECLSRPPPSPPLRYFSTSPRISSWASFEWERCLSIPRLWQKSIPQRKINAVSIAATARRFSSKPIGCLRQGVVLNSDERKQLLPTQRGVGSSLHSAQYPQLSASYHLLPEGQARLEELILEKGLSSHPGRAIGDNLVRCTVFDQEGNCKVVSGEFKRSELLSKHGLLPRDLRKLDTGISSIVPSILVRRNSILVNLLHIRALIKSDLVIIFDVYGSTDSQTQSVFMYDLGHKLRHGRESMGLPYELRALESIFISVITALDAEMQVHTAVVSGILAELEDHIDREQLRHLLIQSKKLSAFLQKATLIREAMNEILEQDEDLAGLFLTDKAQGHPRTETDDHSEAEMLIESYYKHCDEIVQTVGNLSSNIRSTEEIVNIILDANRNSLMLLDLKFQIGTLGLGAGAFIASLYGMNLKNSIEEAEWGFFGVSGGAAFLLSLIILVSLKNLSRVQRITMTSSDIRRRTSKSRFSLNSIFGKSTYKTPYSVASMNASTSAVSASSASSRSSASVSASSSASASASSSAKVQAMQKKSINQRNRSKVWNWLTQGQNFKHY